MAHPAGVRKGGAAACNGACREGAFQTYAQIAQDKGLTLTLAIGDAEGVNRGDPTGIRQILSNLTSNALKFTEHGRIEISAGRDQKGLNVCREFVAG